MQAIWIQPEARRREWNGAILRTYLAMPSLDHMKSRYRAGDPLAMILPEPLPESSIETAMDYLLKWHYKARHDGGVNTAMSGAPIRKSKVHGRRLQRSESNGEMTIAILQEE